LLNKKRNTASIVSPPTFNTRVVESGLQSAFRNCVRSANSAFLSEALSHVHLQGVSTIFEVGGGLGHPLINILLRNAGIKGVVFDVPEIIDLCEHQAFISSLKLGDRLEFNACDIFSRVPEGADCYLLESSFSTMSVVNKRRLLEVVRRAMRTKTKAKLTIIEPMFSSELSEMGAVRSLHDLLSGHDHAIRSLQQEINLVENCGFTVNYKYSGGSASLPFVVLEAISDFSVSPDNDHDVVLRAMEESIVARESAFMARERALEAREMALERREAIAKAQAPKGESSAQVLQKSTKKSKQ